MPIHSHIPQCQHIKVNGVRCGSPALRGYDLCYFHNRTRREFGPELPGFLLPLSLESPEAIQMSLMKVVREIANGTLAPRLASLLLRAIHIAVTNSRRLHFDTPFVRESVPEPKPATKNEEKHLEQPFTEARVGQAPPTASPEGTTESSPARTAGIQARTRQVPQGTTEPAPHRASRETRNPNPKTPSRETRNEERETRVPRVPCGESSRNAQRETGFSDDPLIRQLHDLTHAYLSPQRTERNNGNHHQDP